jgi:hypothetical protein
MAREAGFFELQNTHWDCTTEQLKVFEAFVRADEREACEKEAESWGCHLAAAEIRARGNT